MVTRGETWVRRLAVVATIGMFLVLIMGSTVTNTGSSEGCGRSWPLCHGEFIPAYAFETMIEFSHRFVTGIEGFLLLGTAIGAWKYRGRQRQTKLLIALMLGSVVAQSLLGASAVMWPQSPGILAVHFGISLVCFAATFLLMRLLYEPATSAHFATPVPAGYQTLAWSTLIMSTLVAYVGAYMRHSGNELGCYTWPGCNGAVVPGFAGPEGIAFSHRLLATIAGCMVYSLAIWSYRLRGTRPALYPIAVAAAIFVTAQALIGGAVVLSRLSLASTLGHAGMMALLFVCLADLCRQSLPRRDAMATQRSLSPVTPAPAD